MAPNRIDVHHHFVPDFYPQAVQSPGGDPFGWFIRYWTPELDKKVNQEFGITTSIFSLTTPGACIWKDPKASADLTRKLNKCATKLRNKSP
ncbi:hypothetical protein BJX65DRAFT_305924 [Aspergillus insuetus]